MFVKLGVLLLLGVAVRLAHSNYDVGEMSQVGDVDVKIAGRDRCRPYPAFALAGALEIAYRKQTGKARSFSVQEMVDCFHGGCRISSLEDLVNWVIVNDRLAPRDRYTEYRGKVFTCRAGTTPDGLSRIKLTGMKAVTTDTFEQDIREHGTVLACLDTSNYNCPMYNEHYTGGVITGTGSDDAACTEVVLIVGYDAIAYRVRAAKGAGWGMNGYFRIARGSNTCGIESRMSVLKTEVRMSKPGYSPKTGCPAEYPKFCTKTKTCRASNQKCLKEMKPGRPGPSHQTAQVINMNSGSSYRPGSGGRPVPSGGSSYNFGGLPNRRKREACVDEPMFKCAQRVKVFAVCQNPSIAKLCPATCKMCEEEEEEVEEAEETGADSGGTGSSGGAGGGCTDTETEPGECARLARYCATVPGVRVKCAKTCNTDPADCGDSYVPSIDYSGDVKEPPMGQCYAPRVANGRVMNGQVMRKGEAVRVVCNAGYTLSGETSKCELQNVFSPDTRRLPVCIRLGSEDFSGNGAGYKGRMNTAYTGTVCNNWLELAHTGQFTSVERGASLLQGGNHNFCRNIGGDDFTPFCYTRGGQLKEYCFGLPRCGGNETDKCSSVRTNQYDDCNTRHEDWDCELENETKKARVEYIWSKCGAMCCSYAGCQ